MKLQLHLANPVSAATPMSSASHADLGEVFRGAMQQLLASSSTSMSARQTQALAVSASTAQPSEHPLPAATPVKGTGTNPVDTEPFDLEGMTLKIPLAGSLLPEASAVQGSRVESANAKPQGTHSSTTGRSVAASPAEGQSATKRSVDQDQASAAAVPVAAVQLPVFQAPVSRAENVPAQGMIPFLSPPPSLSPNPTSSLTGKSTTRQGTAQPEQAAIARPGGSVSNGLPPPGASSVHGTTATVHGEPVLPGVASLQGVKAAGIDGPANALPSHAQDALAHSQISTQALSAPTENLGEDALRASRTATDVSTAGGVAVPAPAPLHETSAIESKSPAKEKVETKDGAVASILPSAEHPAGVSSPVHGASSGSAPATLPAEARGTDAPARTPLREISAAQVLQKMDMSASADAVPLRADARHLNVGVQSAAYGWVEVRATAGPSGHVDASLHVQSSISAETLAAHSKDIASYAREQSIQMGQVSVGVGTGDGGRQNPRSANSGTAQEGTPAALIHGDAEIDQGTYRVLDTLSLISLRA